MTPQNLNTPRPPPPALPQPPCWCSVEWQTLGLLLSVWTFQRKQQNQMDRQGCASLRPGCARQGNSSSAFSSPLTAGHFHISITGAQRGERRIHTLHIRMQPVSVFTCVSLRRTSGTHKGRSLRWGESVGAGCRRWIGSSLQHFVQIVPGDTQECLESKGLTHLKLEKRAARLRLRRGVNRLRLARATVIHAGKQKRSHKPEEEPRSKRCQTVCREKMHLI